MERNELRNAGAASAEGSKGAPSPVALVLLCGLILAVDGFDTQAIGYVAPALVEHWDVPRPMLGPVFSAGLLGVMLGSLTLSALADRVGVRKVLLSCCAAFGVLTLANALASNLEGLMALRFLTGVALGGAMPNAVGLAADLAPARRRNLCVSLVISGFSLGGAAGGIAATMLIDDFGWRSVFLVGGAAPLLLMPALLLWTPQAPRRKKGLAKTPVRDLLRPGVRRATLLIWLIYFLNLLVLYTLSNWLPTLVHGAGFSIASASIATTCYQFAGTVGGLVIAWICDQRPAIRVLAASFLAAGASVWLLGMAGSEQAMVLAAASAAGFFVVGGQNAFAAFVSGFYPSGIKATGVGWAVGVGRWGSVLGPLVAGWLFLVGATPATVFKLCAAPAALAALSVLGIGAMRARAQTRTEPEGGLPTK